MTVWAPSCCVCDLPVCALYLAAACVLSCPTAARCCTIACTLAPRSCTPQQQVPVHQVDTCRPARAAGKGWSCPAPGDADANEAAVAADEQQPVAAQHVYVWLAWLLCHKLLVAGRCPNDERSAMAFELMSAGVPGLAEAVLPGRVPGRPGRRRLGPAHCRECRVRSATGRSLLAVRAPQRARSGAGCSKWPQASVTDQLRSSTCGASWHGRRQRCSAVPMSR